MEKMKKQRKELYISTEPISISSGFGEAIRLPKFPRITGIQVLTPIPWSQQKSHGDYDDYDEDY